MTSEASEIAAESLRLEQARSRCPKAEALYGEVMARNGSHCFDMLELALGGFVNEGREVTPAEEEGVWRALGCEPSVEVSSLRQAPDGREMQQMPHSAAHEPQEREPKRMASMDDVYGGNTLKAEELPEGFRAVLVVESVSVQEFDDRDEKGKTERKLVLRFTGKAKGLALNVTNANMMAEIAKSRDYDYWPGKHVLLYRTMTEFQGKRVPAMRLDHANATPLQARPAPPPPPPPPPPAPFQASDDDVPF